MGGQQALQHENLEKPQQQKASEEKEEERRW